MARISRLRVANYRSVGEPLEVVFPPKRPVVLLGENNSGKSNVVKALQLVLGPFWPGTYEPEDHDFFGRERDRTIEISTFFDDADPLGRRYTELVWRLDPASGEGPHFAGRPG